MASALSKMSRVIRYTSEVPNFGRRARRVSLRKYLG